MSGPASAELDEIPVEAILFQVRRAFPDIGPSSGGPGLYWSRDEEGFIVTWSRQHVSFCCFDLDPENEEVLERIFDVLRPFGLEQYDR
jgi:hypothetical protein